MRTNADLSRYLDSVRGQYIDVDRVFGAQCWDQWSHYAMWYGVPAWPTYTNAGGTHPHSGYACNVYHNAHRSGILQWFDILPAGATPRVGDVAFWEYGSGWYPWSHVATVLEVTHGGRMLRCITQNPGAVQIADLIIDGVIGYLRPKLLNLNGVPAPIDTAKTPTLTHTRKHPRRRQLMIMIYNEKANGGKGAWALTGPGYWVLIESEDSAKNLRRQLGNQPSLPVNDAGWKKFQRAAGVTGTPADLTAS